MAGRFSADLSRFAARFGGNMDKTVRYTVVLASQGVIMTSPVLTGRFRSNWQFGIDFPQGELRSFDTSGGSTLARIAGQVTSLRAGGSAWLVNNLPYAGKLEYGHSQQAPAGVVRITLANLPAAIESYVQGLQ